MKKGNATITDVPKKELQDDKKRQLRDAKKTNGHDNKVGKTVSGQGLTPASSTGTSDVAPIVKQNQNTDRPAISMVPPVYGREGVMSLDQKDPWKQAEAKLQHRVGLDFLKTQNKFQVKELIEDEFRRLHNGSLDEDVQTNHHNNEPQE